MMRDARDPLTITVSFKLRAFSVELFDHIYLTITRYGWTAKEFLVVGRSLDGQGTTAGEISASMHPISSV